MSVSLRRAFLFCVFMFSLATLAQTPPRILVTGPVDESQLTVLKGNTHPLARAQYDQGAAPPDLPMQRMLLVLKRSDEQEASLRNLLDSQQDKGSPNYHKWLTPESFGKQFGPSDQDIAQVTSWLQSHGFQVTQVSKGRTVIEFSGTAGQVQEALHTPIHKFSVKGESHWANAADPQIPAALTPVVAGVLSLHNFLKKPHLNMVQQQIPAQYIPGSSPQFTSSTGLHALTPADYRVIYNIPANTTGQQSTIAIVGRSNINLNDVGSFHNLMSDNAALPIIVLNGADPGNLGGGEEAEAVLDSTWSGAVAPNANVLLVVSASTNTTDGVDLSEAYIIDNNLADVMSESFGGCEANLTSADASAISSLAQQAAAQGITYTVSTGDSGSAGCDDPNTETAATGPASVNILASTPYTVAVGGTMFNENGQDGTYWSSTNSSPLGSALSYIPEKVWNESCKGTACGSSTANIWAGSGGASVFFSKPAWQTGFGDAARDIPDVSLTAAGHDPYLLCLANSCSPNAQGRLFFAGVGGTSASAPAFAGIMARVDANGGSRQGLANYVLYKLAAAETYSQCNGSVPGGLQVSTCIFNDVTVGNNSVPGDVDYGTATAKYQTSAGYDMATGLGSVNVTNLLTQWSAANFNSTKTTLSISPLNAVHGDALTVNVQVSSTNTGKPSGLVWLQNGNVYQLLSGSRISQILQLDSTGSFAGPTHQLAGGNYPLTAHYTGDATYGSSDSAPVTVNIQPEASTTTLSVQAKDQNGNLSPFTTITYGTPVFLQAHVAGKSGYGIPTSFVSFSSISTASVDNNGDAIATPNSGISTGSYQVIAAYSGDPSFKPSSSAPISFAVTPAATVTSLSSSPNSTGTTLTANISDSGSGNPPTGSVTFYSGTTSLGTSIVNFAPTPSGVGYQDSAILAVPQLANGQYSLTASYTGDSNYLASTSTPVSVSLQPDFLLTALDPSAITVQQGQSANYAINVNFNDGFSGTVAFSCSGLPGEAVCVSSPSTASGVATLKVNTTAPVGAALRVPASSRPIFLSASLGMGFAGVLLLGAPSRRRYNTFFSLFVLAFLITGIGCGGGGSSSSTTPAITTPVDHGTPAGTYGITVTGSSGTLTHTAKVTLVVQ